MTSMTLVTLFWKKFKSKICHRVQKMTSMNLQKQMRLNLIRFQIAKDQTLTNFRNKMCKSKRFQMNMRTTPISSKMSNPSMTSKMSKRSNRFSPTISQPCTPQSYSVNLMLTLLLIKVTRSNHCQRVLGHTKLKKRVPSQCRLLQSHPRKRRRRLSKSLPARVTSKQRTFSRVTRWMMLRSLK